MKNSMKPVIRWRANQIHARQTTSMLAQEIIRLDREGHVVNNLIVVLHKMLEKPDKDDFNISLTEQAIHFYGKEYELPELNR